MENDLRPKLDQFLAERSGKTIVIVAVARQSRRRSRCSRCTDDPTYRDLRDRSKVGYDASMKIASQHVFQVGAGKGK